MNNENEKMGNVYYNSQSIPKHLFRAFVYNKKGETKLAENWQEFKSMLATGEWFEKKPIAEAATETKKSKAKE